MSLRNIADIGCDTRTLQMDVMMMTEHGFKFLGQILGLLMKEVKF